MCSRGGCASSNLYIALSGRYNTRGTTALGTAALQHSWELNGRYGADCCRCHDATILVGRFPAGHSVRFGDSLVSKKVAVRCLGLTTSSAVPPMRAAPWLPLSARRADRPDYPFLVHVRPARRASGKRSILSRQGCGRAVRNASIAPCSAVRRGPCAWG